MPGKAERSEWMFQGNGLSLSAVDQYLQEVKWIPPLASEEEVQLFNCIAHGVDAQRARNRLTEGCQPMVFGLAKRLVRDCQHMELLDFVQEGNLGLLEAIKRYDTRRSGTSFRTFAFSWVRVSMLLAYWRNERAIRVPLNKVRSIQRMNT